jgi:two-component system OmpR family sensor kinase
VMSVDGIRLAGTDLVATADARATIDASIADAAPAFASGQGGSVVAASPVIIDGHVTGAAVVSNVVSGGLPSWLSLGFSIWLGITIVLLAAVAGWLIAGRISRPIGALTDNMRQLALGPLPGGVGGAAARTRASFPEIETLTAAVQGIAARDTRRLSDDDEKRASLRALSHRLSHQLRTPLSVLRLRVDDLADDRITGERRIALADVVATQIDRLDQLGSDLAELDPARWELRKDPLDIAALAAVVVERNAPLARWGGVSIAFAGRTGPDSTVIGDVAVLDDAIANVVQNAIKYTPRGGRITVTVTRRGGAAFITVRDTGAGISASERADVLRSGVRGSAAALTEGSGHGLGLVVDAAQRHGGHIELDETPGGGTTVRLVIPLAPWALPSEPDHERDIDRTDADATDASGECAALGPT